MGTWWGTARQAAAAEFGRRHYRKILALVIARSIAPYVAGAIVLAGVVYASVVWVAPAVASGAAWTVNLIPALIIGLAVIGLAVAGVLAWGRWGWRLEYRGVTGRMVALAGVAVLALASTGAVMLWPA